MRRRRFLTLLICILLAVSVFGAGFADAASLSDVQSELDDKKSELQEGQEEQEEIEEDISELNSRINKLQDDIDSIQSEINAANVKIKKTAAELAEVEEEMDEQTDDLNRRLRSMYMNDNSSFVDVILNSGSISELMTNIELMKEIHKSDKEMLETLEVQQKKVSEKKEELDELKASLESKQSSIEEKQETLEADKKSLNKKRKSIESENDELEEEIGDLEEEANKLTQELSGSQSSYTGESSGSMIWPCSGTVSCEYGYRYCPFHGYELHTGIDIAVSTGTKIVAAASGVVAQAYYNSSYGNMVLLDNGNGIYTLYAHNSSLCVSVGQEVSQGQVIAYAGSTGSSTGPHCHFEVRVNGQPTNPRNYL